MKAPAVFELYFRELPTDRNYMMALDHIVSRPQVWHDSATGCHTSDRDATMSPQCCIKMA